MNAGLVSLLTVGNGTVSGGHLYNQHMVDQARRHDARVQLVPVTENPDFSNLAGQIVVDSIVAARVGRALPTEPGPLAALVHQVPGGVDGTHRARRARRTADLRLYGMCRLVMAASPSLADGLLEDGIPAAHVEVVPPGCDLPTVAEGSQIDLRRGRKLALLNVANWLPSKGIDDLLDVVESLPPGEAVLHLVGSGEVDVRHARHLAGRLRGLGDGVIVHGQVSPQEMARLYSSADALVTTSRNEGYATVVAEALRAGLPVLGWGVGNIPNLVADGREGRLFDVGDTAGLREEILSLAEDGARLEGLRSKAAVRGRQLPTWQDTGDRFFDALQGILDR